MFTESMYLFLNVRAPVSLQVCAHTASQRKTCYTAASNSLHNAFKMISKHCLGQGHTVAALAQTMAADRFQV